jgi:hypothetical protein
VIFKRRYHYLVTYNFKNKGYAGYGNSEFSIQRKLKTVDDLKEVAQAIQDRADLEEVLVLWFQRV